MLYPIIKVKDTDGHEHIVDMYRMIRADMDELVRKTEDETGIHSNCGGMLP